ncbi:NAD(P)-dependent dehydrogenase (Short-subunit alcohol dehydrogenase family) OS=Castellaniella defragrans OX=75697 GN=HNR28_000946 PE=3 SV=1 [Castellaniella defragrans]
MQEPDWLGLQGRTFAVTGAAHGIGFGIAQGLAGAGARVALLDFDRDAAESAAAELRSRGAQALAFFCDTADGESLQHAAEQVGRTLGACSGLVNNAGILRSAPLAEVDVQEWNRVLSINLTGYLFAARAFHSQLRTHEGGSIVHIASIAGHYPQTNSGAYSASKAGVRLLSRQLAVEWRGDRIRSNTICPGMIRTPLSAAFYAQPGLEARRAAMTASGRVGEPEDIANTALFLLSARSGYVNATDVAVNGGMDAMLMDMVPRPGFNDISNSEA